MEELLNSEYSDQSTFDGTCSELSGEEEVSSNDCDLPLPPPRMPQDHFGVPAQHSSNHIGTPYPTYTPIPLSGSNGISGIKRARFPLVNFDPTANIEDTKQSQYNFQARRGTLRPFPPIRAVENKKYHMWRNHSLAASKLQRQLGEEHVPRDLLAGLSLESDFEACFSHIHDPLSGNQMCLTQVNSATHVVYTTGTLGNQLQCQSMDLESWHDLPSPAFMTPIQQLVSNGLLIGVRSFGGIAFVEMPFQLLGELPLPSTPTDFAFHPTLRRLTASVTTELDIFLWGLGDERPELIACPFSKDAAVDHFMSNLGCVRFGPHPRSLAIGTTEEVCIVDARTFTAAAQSIDLALPGKIWGFDINPTNPVQVGISTTEALLLYDLRFLQRPTLDWRHIAKILPRPHVQFMPSCALLDIECVTTWGSQQGPLVYPLHCTSTVLEPFQFPLPGSKRATCSLGQVHPERISEPTNLYPFGFLEDPSAVAQVGTVLRPIDKGAIEMLQLTEDGAVYRQVFDRVAVVDERLQFDSIEDCSVQSQLGPIDETLAFEGSLKLSLEWATSEFVDNLPRGPFSSYESDLETIPCPWIDVMSQEGCLLTQTFDGWKQRLASTLGCLDDEATLAKDLNAAAIAFYPKSSLSPALGTTATKILEGWGNDAKDVAPVEAPQFTQATQKLPPSIMSQPTAGIASRPSASKFSFSQPPRAPAGRKLGVNHKPKLPGFR